SRRISLARERSAQYNPTAIPGILARNRASAALPLSRLRPTSNSLAPREPRRAAVSSPIPAVAPVIIQVLFFTCSCPDVRSFGWIFGFLEAKQTAPLSRHCLPQQFVPDP